MENSTLNKENYNLDKEHDLFDVLYSVVPSNPTKIFSWTITGFRLEHAENKRCFEYIVTSYPISKYIKFNEEWVLRSLRQHHHIIRRSKEEVLLEAKRILNENIERNLKIIDNLKDDNPPINK